MTILVFLFSFLGGIAISPIVAPTKEKRFCLSQITTVFVKLDTHFQRLWYSEL